jgi:hypothetical protein
MVCYPNPLNSDRLVGMVAGTSADALFQAYDRTGLWFHRRVFDRYKWFDYAVYDARTNSPETFLNVGFFDNRWRLPSKSDGGREWDGLEEWRQRNAPQTFPDVANAAHVEDDELSLCDMFPTSVRQLPGAVGIDRTYAGKPVRLGGKTFDRGLGVRPPSEIRYALPNDFTRFTVTVGPTPGFKFRDSDDENPETAIKFEIWGNGRSLSSSAPLKLGPEGPDTYELSVDVANVAVLHLKTSAVGEQAQNAPAGVWANPTLSR